MFNKRIFMWLFLCSLGTVTICKVFGIDDLPILLAALDGYICGRLVQAECQKEKQ